MTDPPRDPRLQAIDQQLVKLCAADCCTQTATLMTEWLDRALHNDSWARDAPTRKVWMGLLAEVRTLRDQTPGAAS